MKLFKKLAAVMLVAALALTMVGCGSAAVDIKSQIKDYITDRTKMSDDEIVHKDALDKVAEKLLTEADKVYKEDDNAAGLLESEAVLKAAGIEDASDYYFRLEENPGFKSNFMNSCKLEDLARKFWDWLEDGDEYGLATGKIGDTDYILIVAFNAE